MPEREWAMTQFPTPVSVVHVVKATQQQNVQNYRIQYDMSVKHISLQKLLKNVWQAIQLCDMCMLLTNLPPKC